MSFTSACNKSRSRNLWWCVTLAVFVVCGALSGLLGSAEALAASSGDGRAYEAEIRRTAYGILHIKADDYGSLGFGTGYAFAEDNLCVLADSILTVRAERSRFLGATEENIGSDLFFQWLRDSGIVQDVLEGNTASPAPSADARALNRGYVAGYNAYLEAVGVDNLPDPTCRGQAWVRPITELDLWLHGYKTVIAAGTGLFVPDILAATPPTVGAEADTSEAGADTGPTAADAGPLHSLDMAAVLDPIDFSKRLNAPMASNAYAIGRDATADGTGMLLANPHLLWHGDFRFYQLHQTIPGEIDVTGATIFGVPFVLAGHTDAVAWTITNSAAQRFALYAVPLVPGSPTTYVYDGEPREMTARTVTITIMLPDGTLAPYSHTFYETHYGPVIQSAELPWTSARAFTIRDANRHNARPVDTWLGFAKATSVRDIKAALDRHQGQQYVNTTAVDAHGEVFYGDHSVAPHVTAAQMAACGWPVMDGSRSACEWGIDDDAVTPGIFGPGNSPTLFRTDYVANMNNTHWLANPEQPLTGYSPVFGLEEADLSWELGAAPFPPSACGRASASK